MLIQSMTKQDSLELIMRMRLGRLACSQAGQSYVIPHSFVCDKDHLYSFSTEGQMLSWMRANPLVCVEVEELVSDGDWATVIVMGHFEELTDTPEYQEARVIAFDLLYTKSLWWEPGYVKTILDGVERPLSKPTYFRILFDEISGHRGVADTATDQVKPA
jgi:nitroimidazol reductase NimA-like FMN-containing flavoprotein (pyridoxamine 5'-phosphate oxidase superfamily)